MTDMSDFLENELAQWMFGSVATTIFGASDPATLDVRLAKTSSPTDAAFTEYTDAGYAGQNVPTASWEIPTPITTNPFTVWNDVNIDFGPITAAAPATVTGVGIFRVGITANWLLQKAASKALNQNDILRIPGSATVGAAGLQITLA